LEILGNRFPAVGLLENPVADSKGLTLTLTKQALKRKESHSL
jgi:hypothetical protein